MISFERRSTTESTFENIQPNPVKKGENRDPTPITQKTQYRVLCETINKNISEQIRNYNEKVGETIKKSTNHWQGTSILIIKKETLWSLIQW